jgi:hypothetical protein
MALANKPLRERRRWRRLLQRANQLAAENRMHLRKYRRAANRLSSRGIFPTLTA